MQQLQILNKDLMAMISCGCLDVDDHYGDYSDYVDDYDDYDDDNDD